MGICGAFFFFSGKDRGYWEGLGFQDNLQKDVSCSTSHTACNTRRQRLGSPPGGGGGHMWTHGIKYSDASSTVLCLYLWILESGGKQNKSHFILSNGKV